MYQIDISLKELSAILDEVRSAGGDAVRFTIYEEKDEVPLNFTTTGLKRPAITLDAGNGSFFPRDHV